MDTPCSGGASSCLTALHLPHGFLKNALTTQLFTLHPQPFGGGYAELD